ncbi:RDD family protein [Glaciecola sp. 2405UD65-10]|jgi:uncharacterized RDD family membrane protein YckC|uniref:RDD family protein n=1 Tax=Glaciecola sp. 2405UD65-10 TaxID=3397244 RepID=UPI003B5A9245
MSESNFKRAGFIRRLAAMVYDALIAVAVGMLAALILIGVLTALLENGVLSKQGYEHVNDLIQGSVVYKGVIQAWVVLWVSCFFLWFWKHGGQTLGMRAWRLRLFNLHSDTEKPIGYGKLILRLLASLGGLGTLLVLLDFKSKLALQDRVAGTQMLVLSKEENHHKNW